MTTLPRPVVRLVVCGNADRGDDGAALTAAATLLPSLTPVLASRIEVRRCPNLRTEDLLDLPDGVQAVIIDAVIGPPPGELVRVPLCALAARAALVPIGGRNRRQARRHQGADAQILVQLVAGEPGGVPVVRVLRPGTRQLVPVDRDVPAFVAEPDGRQRVAGCRRRVPRW